METLPFWLWPFAGALAGLIIGSFLATLVIRWPAGASLGGRSRCDQCGASLGVADLIPLLSWAWRRGRCRHCGAAIDWRHPAIELGAALIGALALAALPAPAGFAGALFGWLLLALLVLDAEHLWLPDRLTIPLLAAGLLLGRGAMADRVVGAAIGGGALLLVAGLYRWLRRRAGMGLGDVKLMAGLGAWLGWPALPPLLLGAAVLGLGLAGLAAARRQPVGHIPFGACLAACAFPLWIISV